MASDLRKKRRPKPSPSSQTLFPVEPTLDSLPTSRPDITRLLAVLSIAAAVAVACNFIADSLNHPPKPFCDTAIPEFSDSLSDACEPCPTNGICNDGKLECHYGYKKHGKLCIEDGDINEAAKKLLKRIEVLLCEGCAQYLCTGTGKCWFSEDELRNSLDENKFEGSHGPDETLYLTSKERAMKNVSNLMEIRRIDNSVVEVKCPELLVNNYKPLSCAVRHWVIKQARVLVPSCALFVGCLLFLFRSYQRHQLSLKAEQIYHEVCDILEEKPLMSSSRSGEGEPWVVASWLRDHLLSPKERKDPSLWRKVEELVQEDSRIDQYPKLVKGESKVVWEWQVEGSVGSLEKRKRTDRSGLKWKDSPIFFPNIQNKMHADKA